MNGSASGVRAQVGEAEWQVRVDLAACCRLMAEYGMLFSEITASSLIRVDLDGTVLCNASDYGINPAGWVIHGCIHRARHDVDAIRELLA